jgi:hypothetical protein
LTEFCGKDLAIEAVIDCVGGMIQGIGDFFLTSKSSIEITLLFLSYVYLVVRLVVVGILTSDDKIRQETNSIASLN